MAGLGFVIVAADDVGADDEKCSIMVSDRGCVEPARRGHDLAPFVRRAVCCVGIGEAEL